MLSYEICEFTTDHADALRQIYLQSRQRTFTWLDTTAYTGADFDAATKDEEILVAICEGQPVGFVAWYAPDDFVHHLFVDPAHTGKGVGKKLLASCLAKLGRPARLKCLQRNTVALNFYRSQGWHRQEQGESAEGRYDLLVLDH